MVAVETSVQLSCEVVGDKLEAREIVGYEQLDTR
jgi:hypothetical protein